MRNRIVHDYGVVDMSVIYDTVSVDIPEMLEILKKDVKKFAKQANRY